MNMPRTAGLAVLALCLVQFVDVLGVTAVVTARPAMLTGRRAPADAASPISAGYAMFFGGLLMAGARRGGRRRHAARPSRWPRCTFRMGAGTARSRPD
jgi:hypothetical protein